MVKKGITVIMAITAFMTNASAMTLTGITVILVMKAIRPMISNKAMHTYVASNMTITDIMYITVITTIMAIIGLTSIITIISHKAKYSVRNSGLQFNLAQPAPLHPVSLPGFGEGRNKQKNGSVSRELNHK